MSALSVIRRVGIIGCGTLARTNYHNSLPRLEGLAVTCVHDRDAEAARLVAGLFGAEPVGLKDLLARVDTVIVATPPATHYDLVRAGIERGVTVVCEKPLVGHAEEARSLVRLAENVGVPLYVGHLRRTFPNARLARDLIRNGALGAVRRIELAEGSRFAWETQSGYVTADPLGGVLFDTGSHVVDLALFACGLDGGDLRVEVDRVRRDRPEPTHEIDAELRLGTAIGEIPVRLRLSRYRALANRVRIELERGAIDIPVGPRDRIRVTGPGGSCVVPAGPAPADFNEYFVLQWQAMFGGREAEEFRAEHFLGLTTVLETIAQAA